MYHDDVTIDHSHDTQRSACYKGHAFLTPKGILTLAPHGLRVNAVAPTYIATPLLKDVKDSEALIARWTSLTPMARLGEPHEVASAVQFLASDAASLITGAILSVDGGYTCF